MKLLLGSKADWKKVARTLNLKMNCLAISYLAVSYLSYVPYLAISYLAVHQFIALKTGKR